MVKASSCVLAVLLSGMATLAAAQTADFKPVTDEMLANPSPADWLMINRTYDEQRFSPLDRSTAAMSASSHGLDARHAAGHPGIDADGPPRRDVLMAPGAGVQALDATNGDLIWEYWRNYPKDMAQIIGAATLSRGKNLAMFEDMVYFAAPDGFIVALDARTGKVRWETKANDYNERHRTHRRPDGRRRQGDQQPRLRRRAPAASSPRTTPRPARRSGSSTPRAAPGEPGGDTWGGLPRRSGSPSSWGLPGSYDPVRKVLYWAIANPTPYTRLKRHGNADAVPSAAPADLYSNSTLALDAETGKLVWYYQHLPGDDWDSDHIHERTLVHTKVSPDPKFVKWINPAIKKGEERDIVVEVAEAGDMFALDRDTGKFLWATPFPYDAPDSRSRTIDVETGRTHINVGTCSRREGDKRLVCSHNTRSWWSTAYDPRRNALYVPFQDACLDMTANDKTPTGYGPRGRRPASRHRPEERIRRHREGEPLHRRDDAHPFAAMAGQRLRAGHRRRSDVLGRPQPPLPRL